LIAWLGSQVPGKLYGLNIPGLMPTWVTLIATGLILELIARTRK
jgi:hypothetical protein